MPDTRRHRASRLVALLVCNSWGVLFGSDFPHPEGLGDPVSFAKELEHLPEEWQALMLGGNLARLMNLENSPILASV